MGNHFEIDFPTRINRPLAFHRPNEERRDAEDGQSHIGHASFGKCKHDCSFVVVNFGLTFDFFRCDARLYLCAFILEFQVKDKFRILCMLARVTTNTKHDSLTTI